MKYKWLLSILSVLVILSLALTACGPKAAEMPEGAAITFAWTQEPDNMNPFYTDMWFSAILQQFYLCWAWEFDDQNAAFPNLVTEIPSIENGGLSEDGLTITMHLRDDIVWSDGEPITSTDFKFTYDMIMDEANTVNSQYPYDALTGIDTPDDQTVVMNFSEPFAPWLSAFWHGILPQHILQPVFDESGSIAQAEWNLMPTVGCGPYLPVEWESGSFMRFERNTNYWKGTGKLGSITLQFVPDDAAQTAALLSGDVQLGTFMPYTDVPALEEAGIKILTVNSGYAEGWFFNFRDMAHPGAKDPVVRQAIAMAIDREAISKDLNLGLTTPVETLWDPFKAEGYVSADIVPWSYDPEGAKALLEENGYVDSDGDGIREDLEGNPLTLTHGTTIREIRQDIQAVAQQQLLDVGIDLQIFSEDSDIFFGSYADSAACAMGEYDIMEWSDSTLFPDVDSEYWLCDQMPSDEYPDGYNYFGCDEKLSELFVAQKTMTDPEERKAVFQEITQYMHDQVYWLGIYNDPDLWAIAGNLTGVKLSGITPFYNIMEWDVAAE